MDCPIGSEGDGVGVKGIVVQRVGGLDYLWWVWSWRGSGCGRKVEVPELAGVGGAMASENGGAVELDRGGSGVEVGGASMVAEWANGDEGARGEVWKDVGGAGGGREGW